MYKVLIISADPNELNTLSYIIDWESHSLEIAGCLSDSEQALSFLAENPVDILVMNPRLSTTDGIDLLQEIRTMRLDTRCILCYADYSYLSRVLALEIDDYLLTPLDAQRLQDALLGCVQKLQKIRTQEQMQSVNLQLLQESIFYRWISGALSKVELESLLDSIGIHLPQGGFTVALIHTVIDDTTFVQLRQKEFLRICNENLPESCPIPAFYDLDNNIVLLFPTERLERSLLALEQMMAQISAEQTCNVFTAIGSYETDYMQVHKSYETAKRFVSPFLVMPSHSVIFHSDPTAELLPRSSNNGSPFLLNQTFDELMLGPKHKQCLTDLDNLFSDASISESVPPTFLRNHIVELIMYVLNVLRNHNIDVVKVFGDDTTLFYKVTSFHNMQNLYDWMREFLTTALEVLENKNMRLSPCIARAVAHIEKNYTQDISLKTMANDLNINAAYLGQLFKVETGQLFSAYLNQTRIENAKKLLLTTSLALSDVSQQCGYTNISYFYNIFKKFTGQTPSQYRKSKVK